MSNIQKYGKLPFEIFMKIMEEFDGRWHYSFSRNRWICKIDRNTDLRYTEMLQKYSCNTSEKTCLYSLDYLSGYRKEIWVNYLFTKNINDEQRIIYTAYYTKHLDNKNRNEDAISYNWINMLFYMNEYGDTSWQQKNTTYGPKIKIYDDQNCLCAFSKCAKAS